MGAFVELKKVGKQYRDGNCEVDALQGIDLEIERGKITAFLGNAGSGKTTLLNLIGGLDAISAGKLFLDGERISRYTPRQLAEYRRHDVAYVMQSANLIENLTALENVEAASQFLDNAFDAAEALDRLGLDNQKDLMPAHLSGDEKQRVAIARAIAKNTKLLLCDEPTAVLDTDGKTAILSLLRDCCNVNGTTILLATSDPEVAKIADRVIRLEEGKVVYDTAALDATPVQNNL